MSLISRQISRPSSVSRLRGLAPSSVVSPKCAGFATNQQGGAAAAEEDGGDDRGDITFQSWLKDVGWRYKNPKPHGTSWLYKDRPFPMNTSFKPPPPLGADLRQALFNLHVSDPEKHSIRELSQRFGLGLKRVEAVIRLKGEEVKWQMEGRTLRKNYERVMESTMAVKPYKPAERVFLQESQSNSRAADQEADNEGASTAPKKGVQKLWWEGVEDGKDAIVGPTLLARAAELAQKAAESEAATAQFAASHSHIVEPAVPGRSPTVFVDVGQKFTDVKEEAKRQKAADARRRLKQKKHTA